jgi:hypothetical protein
MTALEIYQKRTKTSQFTIERSVTSQQQPLELSKRSILNVNHKKPWMRFLLKIIKASSYSNKTLMNMSGLPAGAHKSWSSKMMVLYIIYSLYLFIRSV